MPDNKNYKLQYYDEFEYTTISGSSLSNVARKLNENYGKDGWDIVTVEKDFGNYIALLKRKLITTEV